jgi:glycosyltransferase involved in cell wall biosynthesis
METIDERKIVSALKQPLYRWLFFRSGGSLEGVLAAGATTSNWIADRGVTRSRIFDFAYFMSTPTSAPQVTDQQDQHFRILYAGALIERKNVALVIEALSHFPSHVGLDVVGDGPLRATLEEQATALGPGRVTFHGTCPMSEVSSFMGAADCLVLPSDHDGWGAVIVEALLAGTPVVCSDRCGAGVVVHASGAGSVFHARSLQGCVDALQSQVAKGRPTRAERTALAKWAYCLTEQAGAAYLEKIIAHLRHGATRPDPPWMLSKPFTDQTA